MCMQTKDILQLSVVILCSTASCIVNRVVHTFYFVADEIMQGCALGRTTGIPKAPNYEIWGAQCLSFMQKVSFSSHPKRKVSGLRPSGAARAQPCHDFRDGSY